MNILYFDITTWILAWILCIMVYIIYTMWYFNTFKKMGVKGPKPIPILGTMIAEMKSNLVDPQLERMKEYGNLYGCFEGRVPHLYVADPVLLKEILVKQFHNFTDRRIFDGFSGDLDDALPNLRRENWKRVRSLLSPTYSSGKIKKMVPLLDEVARNLVRSIKSSCEESPEIDIKRKLASFTTDSIATTAFGLRIDSQKDADNPFVKNISTLSNLSFQTPALLIAFFMPFLMKPLGKLFGLSFISKDAQAFFRNVITNEIHKRQTKNEAHVDFLQLMHNAHTDNLDDTDSKSETSLTVREIFGNSMMFFFAGYETTASLLTYLLYNLALHPDKQENLYAEIVDGIGDDQPSYENVQNMQYLDMCINESLRMFPPAVKFDRQCVAETVVEGFKIPKGLIIDVPVYAIHHSPDLWENPNQFDPERFSPEKKAKHTAFQFLPFGYGPRNCIGMRLALIEAKIACAHILKAFKFSVGEKTEIPPKMKAVGLLTPNSLWLKVEER